MIIVPVPIRYLGLLSALYLHREDVRAAVVEEAHAVQLINKITNHARLRLLQVVAVFGVLVSSYARGVREAPPVR